MANDVISIQGNDKPLDITIANFQKVDRGVEYPAKYLALCEEIELLLVDRLEPIIGKRLIVSKSDTTMIAIIMGCNPLAIKHFVISPSIIAKIIDDNFTFLEKRAYTKICLAEICTAVIELFITNLLYHKDNVIINHQLRKLFSPAGCEPYPVIDRHILEESITAYFKDAVFDNPGGYTLSNYTFLDVVSKRKTIKIMRIFAKALYTNLCNMIVVKRLDITTLSK